jgi:hypothetical protein
MQRPALVQASAQTAFSVASETTNEGVPEAAPLNKIG